MKEQPSYFAIIPANVRYSAIPDRAKLLFGEITALAQKDGYCFASNSYFAAAYNCTPQAISQHIATLEQAGFLRIEHNKSAGNMRKIWPIMDAPYKAQLETPIKHGLIPSQAQLKHNNTSIKEQDIKDTMSFSEENDPAYLVTVVSIESAQKEQDMPPPPAEQIIDYLNAKTGRKYRAKTATTAKAINARLEDGYTVADFFAVIDNRVAAWLHKPDMAEYLRPETLFRPAHFESYLNAGINPAKANTDGTLRDCTLPTDIAPRYEAYFNHALQTYPALLESATKVFSHCDYLDYWNNTSTPGLPFSLTPSDKRRVMLTVHEQLNANKYLREKYSSVFAAYLVAVKQSMKQEQIKL